jgi:hypothetical protein
MGSHPNPYANCKGRRPRYNPHRCDGAVIRNPTQTAKNSRKAITSGLLSIATKQPPRDDEWSYPRVAPTPSDGRQTFGLRGQQAPGSVRRRPPRPNLEMLRVEVLLTSCQRLHRRRHRIGEEHGAGVTGAAHGVRKIAATRCRVGHPILDRPSRPLNRAVMAAPSAVSALGD